MIKILDCTLRDGGYYTNWDFNKTIVNEYIEATNKLPVDYLEIGYRSVPENEYMGKYGYCPIFELKDLREKSLKKIVVMLNEKSTRVEDLKVLIEPIKGYVDMIRLAIDPQNLHRALELAEAIKKQGFEVGFNVMYMSKWKELGNFLGKLKYLNGIADLFCMVDSFGGVNPNDIKETINIVKQNTNVPIGFHGHNNLELALINALTAIENGVDFVDSTVLGMGRGAGNLKTELLLTYLNSNYNVDVDFNTLGNLITSFIPLHEKHNWGTNLPYMLSGANSLPQKDVMDWVTNRIYSFNSIVRALHNKKGKVEDNKKFPQFEATTYDKVIIVGGGDSPVEHKDAIEEFIKQNNSIALIHASSRNAGYYLNIQVPQYFCLVGSEGQRLSKAFPDETGFNHICLLPPFPRKMGTDVPEFAENKTFELKTIEFTDKYTDSCTAIVLEAALLMNAKSVFIIGYDGYPDGVITQKERDLSAENEHIFKTFKTKYPYDFFALAPSYYNNLEVKSIYQFI